MKKLLTIIAIVAFTQCVWAQKLNDEHPVALDIDRSSYIAGEPVLFNVFVYSELIKREPLGDDVYVDIVDQNGNWIIGTIARETNGTCFGTLNIPDSVSSGFYNIRAYTNYPNMENFYCGREIYVFNRFGNSQPNQLTDALLTTTKSNQRGLINSSNEIARRQKVSVTINNSLPDSIFGTIRITKRNQWENKKSPFYGQVSSRQITDDNNSIMPYNGLFISGKVTDANNQPISGCIVLLSSVDSLIRLKYDVTDQNGSFGVQYNNYYGKLNIVASAFEPLNMIPIYDAQITLDEQFTKTIESKTNLEKDYSMTIDSLELNKSIIAKAYEFASYSIDTQPMRPTLFYDNYFIGKTLSHTVNTDDYLELNNFNEISRELLNYVKIRNRQGKPEARVVTSVGSTTIVAENPLVLVDAVQLTDISKIIDWGTKKIKRVDTQTRQRNYGNVIFKNGIVMIWTRNFNFWTEENLPRGTYMFSINSFQQPIVQQTENTQNKADKVPQVQPCIYWNPSITVAPNQNNEFEFTASDEKGDFVIELFAIDKKGNYITDYKFITFK